MAPRKNVDKVNPTKKCREKGEKTSKKKTKKEKLKFKSPSIIKFKLPPVKITRISDTLSQISSVKPPPVETRPVITSPVKRSWSLTPPPMKAKPMKLTYKEKRAANRKTLKLARANEVALVQLNPAAAVPGSHDASEVAPPPPKARVLKKGRPKKPLLRISQDLDNSATEAVKKTKKKAAKKPKIDKKPIEITKTTAPSKRKADSTSKKSSKKPKKSKSLPTKSCKPEASPNKRSGRGKILDEISSPRLDDSPSILTTAFNYQKDRKAIENLVSFSKTADTSSQKTSITSLDAMSWTKDISSSSVTCVTVESPEDFYRFDKKMPVIQIPDISRSLTNPAANDKREFINETPKRKPRVASTPVSNVRSDHLSTSSSPSKSLTTSSTNRSSVSQTEQYYLDKIASCLKKVDLEILTWAGYEEEIESLKGLKIPESALIHLQPEFKLIEMCKELQQHLARYASDRRVNNETEMTGKDTVLSLESVTDPNLVNMIEKSEDDEFTRPTSRYVMFDSCSQNEEPLLSNPTTENCEEDFLMDRDSSFDQCYYNDDDDALSLYAESITAIDSARLDNSVAQFTEDIEEYVPEPVTLAQPPKVTYNPTKIDDIEVVKTRIVCEKQNADSTSFKEPDSDKEPVVVLETKSDAKAVATVNDSVALMADSNQSPMTSRSAIFRGICFFNLISNCKKAVCVHPHEPLSPSTVKVRLRELPEKSFIAEYLLLRRWPVLRATFGSVYIDECLYRRYTRPLVEMALDQVILYNKYPEDPKLKILAVESALLHLNDVDLSICDDLLLHPITTTPLCVTFMKAIAETQNFSQFKSVFIKLTYLMADKGFQFDSDVTAHVLERVGILPAELPLCRAMFTMIKNTDRVIFSHSMMKLFESRLLSLNYGLLGEFITYKQESGLGSSLSEPGPQPSPPLLALDTPSGADRERYTSPDTTKLESMNKPAEDPMIARARIRYSPQQSLGSSSSVSKCEDPAMRDKFRIWKPSAYRPMEAPRPPMGQWSNGMMQPNGPQNMSRTNAPHLMQSRPNAPHFMQSGPISPHSMQSRPNNPHSMQSRPNAPYSMQSRPISPHSMQIRPIGPHSFMSRPNNPHSMRSRPMGPHSMMQSRPSGPRSMMQSRPSGPRSMMQSRPTGPRSMVQSRPNGPPPLMQIQASAVLHTNQRQVSFGPPPAKFLRRSGPNYDN